VSLSGWLELCWALCLGGAIGVPWLRRSARPAAFAALVIAQSLAVGGLAWTGLQGLPVSIRLIRLWSLGPLGHLVLQVDPIAALFLAVTAAVFLVTAPHVAAELHSLGTSRREAAFCTLYPLLLAAIVLLLVAGDVVGFLIGWELMSLLIYGLALIGAERARRPAPSYLMLALGEAGTLAGAVGLLLLVPSGAHADFASVRAAIAGLSPSLREAAFALTLLGFGVKAGLVPVNQWLAPVYATAPRPFTPVLAGATVNLGVYALLRIGADLGAGVGLPAGLLTLALGAVTALVGILYATIQPTLRRTLAHSSIENMGLVVTGLGAALCFRALGHPVAGGLALVAGLYHMLNHSLLKSLLFVGAGAVERAAGEENMDRLGGLARHMPWVGALMLIGVLGIAALPPLNGFVSEWLILQSLLRSALLDSPPTQVAFALAGAAVALTVGLAVTCFVKLYAMSFLGMARSPTAAAAQPAPASTRTSLALLGAGCLALGLLPTAVLPVLGRIVASFFGPDPTSALVPAFFAHGASLPPAFLHDFHDLGAQLGQGWLPLRGLVVLHRGGATNPVVFAMSTTYMAVVLAALCALVWSVLRVVARRPTARTAPVWDGGLRSLPPDATYTATGFSNPVRVVFDALLRPQRREDTARAVSEHFRTAVRLERDETHLLDRLVLHPIVAAFRWLGNRLRLMHQGSVNAYAFYMLLVVVGLLVMGAFA